MASPPPGSEAGRIVQRSLELTAQSPHSVHDIRAALGDEAYWSYRLGVFSAGRPNLTSLDTDSDGTTSVSMTMRFGAEQLPDSLRRLRLPGLEIVQGERWYALEGDELRGEIHIDAPRTPITGSGSVLLTPAAEGTRLAGTAVVKVNVPVIGGTIANFIAGQLAQGIVDIVDVTDSWLVLNP